MQNDVTMVHHYLATVVEIIRNSNFLHVFYVRSLKCLGLVFSITYLCTFNSDSYEFHSYDSQHKRMFACTLNTVYVLWLCTYV